MNDFDPTDHDRLPREEGYKAETRQIAEFIENRGDQRIGQLLINAVRETDQFDKIMEKTEASFNEAAELVLWNIEAPELLKALEQLKKLRQ